MKVLFAVSNEEISESIVKRYQKEYKEIISYKNVYYFNAIIKELQKDKSYDRVVISEDLEAFTHTQYEQIDKFIFDKLDSISDEASNNKGDDIPIILICSDRRTKSEQMLAKLFGIGVYNAILGNDRSVEEVCKLIHKPRAKKDAKNYYKIDSDDVNYQPENENDVGEVEIQNILAHYKRLGKNENAYIESFDRIAAQYNDVQLKIICKFLPLNVRAVLEEKSPKYQQVMAFNQSVSGSLRNVQNAPQDLGPTEKLLKPKTRETILTKPVVIPSAVNMNQIKKLSKPKSETNDFGSSEAMDNQAKAQTSVKPRSVQPQTMARTNEENETQRAKEQPRVSAISQNKNEEVVKSQTEKQENPEMRQEAVQPQPAKRGRGRPKKNVVPEEIEEEPKPKRKRGRPKKNPDPVEENQEAILPGWDDVEEEDVSPILPGFESDEQETTSTSAWKNDQDIQEEGILPGLEEMPQAKEEPEETFLPGFDSWEDESSKTDNRLPGFEDEPEQSVTSPSSWQPIAEPSMSYQEINQASRNQVQEPMQDRSLFAKPIKSVDLSSLLTPDKKLACFVGTSKNGTSFMVNHMAEILSARGINTAILDTTQNRNSYYIYTKNEEDLRNIAASCVENLVEGRAQGIKAKPNLTVYTSLPDDNHWIDHAGEILQTLLTNHTVVLVDCDFSTPIEYFAQTQELYLVQSLDVLTIQPLTAFLRELKAKSALVEEKIRIVLNKVVKVRGINEKTIIGGMAFYNDPSMSFMTELFDRNLVKYMLIPFDEEVYMKYLGSLVDCEISLKGYPKNMIQSFQELANMVYSVSGVGVAKSKGKSNYQPPSIRDKDQFSSTMNSTLDQMRKY